MSDKKVIPISSNTACALKWAFNTFYTYSGEASSCHRVKEEPISLENFETEINNTPAVINDRRRMRSGEWPEAGRGCEYCKKIEDSGGTSDRLATSIYPWLSEVNMESDNHFPLLSEVYLSNTCDLKCVYCTPELSSKINSELIKYGADTTGQFPFKKVDTQDAYTEKYLSWVDKNYSSLRRLQILGGEPLLQKEFWRLIKKASTKANPELVISINTNLNADLNTVVELVEIAKTMVKNRHIKRFDIVCSLDCWGEQAEFVRYGLKLERWQQNFEYLLKQKWIYISVLHVVSSLTIKTMWQLQNIIENYKNNGFKISQQYHLVTGKIATELYHPLVFGSNFFKDSLNKLVNSFPVTDPWDNEEKKRIVGITKYLSSGNTPPDITRLNKLKDKLDEFDIRRGTDWKSLYPEINEFMLEHVV